MAVTCSFSFQESNNVELRIRIKKDAECRLYVECGFWFEWFLLSILISFGWDNCSFGWVIVVLAGTMCVGLLIRQRSGE